MALGNKSPLTKDGALAEYWPFCCNSAVSAEFYFCPNQLNTLTVTKSKPQKANNRKQTNKAMI